MDDLCRALEAESRRASPQVVIEAFQFGGWRMPTREQLRLMVYRAILHGAKGEWSFCYGTSARDAPAYGPGSGLHDDPSMCASTAELNAEIEQLSQAIMAPPRIAAVNVRTETPVAPDRYGYLPIHHRLCDHDGYYALLVANGSKPVRTKSD
ncbi:MAG: hypothetical protein AB1778_05765 [Candidatus Bipolaricaulota bacterium]